MILFLLIASLLSAESFDTVTRKIVTDYTTGFIQATIPNIGQSQHQVQFVYSNNGAGPCTASAVNLYIEASQDGQYWNRISPVIASSTLVATNTYSGMITATGGYPQLRLSRDSISLSGCKLNAWYMGTLPPPGIAQLLPAAAAGYFSASVGVSAAGDYTVLSPPSTQGKIVVYGMVLYNGAAVNQILVTERTTSCTGTIVGTLFSRAAIQANTEFVRNRSIVPLYVANNAGSLICIQTTAAGAADIQLTYRVE